jgi:Trypsin-co-occurring domain 1
LVGSARGGARCSASSAADAPHEITIEVAAQLGADAAVIIARAGAGVDVRIALKWMPEPPASLAPRCPRTADTG